MKDKRDAKKNAKMAGKNPVGEFEGVEFSSDLNCGQCILSGFSFCAPIPDGAVSFDPELDAPSELNMPDGVLCCIDDTSCASDLI